MKNLKWVVLCFLLVLYSVANAETVYNYQSQTIGKNIAAQQAVKPQYIVNVGTANDVKQSGGIANDASNAVDLGLVPRGYWCTATAITNRTGIANSLASMAARLQGSLDGSLWFTMRELLALNTTQGFGNYAGTSANVPMPRYVKALLDSNSCGGPAGAATTACGDGLDVNCVFVLE